jgi:hypothetical protein
MSYVATPFKPTTQERRQFNLAGHVVPQSMHIDAERAKKAGQKVYFVSAGEAEALKGRSDEDCANCGGFGHFALEIVMGGPFRNAPPVYQGRSENARDDVHEPKLHLYAAWHNDAWWSVTRTVYDCPVCSPGREILL